MQASESRKASGISKYEKAVLLMTAGFFLLVGGWFWSEQTKAKPYQVMVLEPQNVEPELPAPSAPEREAIPDSLIEGEILNVNTAGAKDLERLPGIGEKRAQDIVAYREEHGLFTEVDAIMNVSGIGPGIMERIRPYVRVGDDT